MSANAQQQFASTSSSSGAVADPGPIHTTPGKHGRPRHARTHASLTSSSGSATIDSPPFPRRSSIPNDASRIFQATGFDPFSAEPDTLFRSLTVKEVDAYEKSVRSTALGKQEELRSLVGQRYEDLLGTATTVIDMAGSSEQLSIRLQKLSEGVKSAAVLEDQAPSSPRSTRRKSSLPSSQKSRALDSDASSQHREAIYVLGASLRLIMDAPEYVWKSIEKGKTLQAAWAFLLTRATWLDLIESRPHPGSPIALANEGEAGISSISQAVSLLKVNVKKMFPFIEKQWQTMLPMRRQIVSRAVSLLSDTIIESMAVVDQLAALMLIDGSKLGQVKQLLLSRRLTAMQRLVQRRCQIPDQQIRGEDASPSKEDQAAQTSHMVAQLVNLFARTLQHAMQMFILPPRMESETSTRPLLLHLLSTITDSDNLASGRPAAASPSAERTLLFPQSASINDSSTARQSAAALRALRRRSDHGLPIAEATEEADSEAVGDRSQSNGSRPLRVSTVSVVEALPSGKILSRLLPASIWTFAPQLDLDSETPTRTTQFNDLSNWSAKARDVLIAGADSKAHSLRSLLTGLSDVSELALVRRTLRLALHRARRTLSRKLAGSESEERKEALSHVQSELHQFEEAIDSILQERLLQLTEQQLQHAVQKLLRNTEEAVSGLSQETGQDTPLDALFHPIEAYSRPDRTFDSTLQDHVHGRSKEVDDLASLYEGPLATLSADLLVYQAELEADERFATASKSIRLKFESIVAAARAEVEKGLNECLDQGQVGNAVSTSASLVMRLIAVLAGKGSQRQPIVAALERYWRPQLERRIADTLGTTAANSTTESSASLSSSMLSTLSTVSESIVQLGPALAGKELAQQVRALLEGLASSTSLSTTDAKALQNLLTCEATSLSQHVSTDTGLRSIRLALSPLVLALAITAPSQPDHTGLTIIAPAEPVSTSHTVTPILRLSRAKLVRFSPLPVR